jgi:hypothetical protein
VRLLPAKQQATVPTVKQLLSAEEESGESRFRFRRNGQLARVAGFSIAQE